MPSTDQSKGSASSGIHTSESGERHIPQSVRPDGSVRKEIKVRPGYRPPEDVEVYKNRTAEAWKTRGSKGVPGAEGLDETQDSADAKKGKNAKRREARKKAKATEHSEQTQDSGEGPKPNGNATTVNEDSQAEQAKIESQTGESALNGGVDEDMEKEKQARNLKKKLRQAKELKEKKESGESLLPEQFAKVIKIQELMRQLDALGFDGDGPKNPVDTR